MERGGRRRGEGGQEKMVLVNNQRKEEESMLMSGGYVIGNGWSIMKGATRFATMKRANDTFDPH